MYECTLSSTELCKYEFMILTGITLYSNSLYSGWDAGSWKPWVGCWKPWVGCWKPWVGCWKPWVGCWKLWVLGRVLKTMGRVQKTMGRVLKTMGRVLKTVGRVLKVLKKVPKVPSEWLPLRKMYEIDKGKPKDSLFKSYFHRWGSGFGLELLGAPLLYLWEGQKYVKEFRGPL